MFLQKRSPHTGLSTTAAIFAATAPTSYPAPPTQLCFRAVPPALEPSPAAPSRTGLLVPSSAATSSPTT
ncbi:hypothetical protein V5799_027375, partial [Amblyomma americanum]